MTVDRLSDADLAAFALHDPRQEDTTRSSWRAGRRSSSTHLVLEGGDVYAGWLATRPPSEAAPATDGDL